MNSKKKASRKRALIERDGLECWLCGTETVVGQQNHYRGMSIDHVVPRSQGGTDDLENLRVACRHCNNKHGLRLLAKIRNG